MRLTLQTDYALRILIHLAAHSDETVSAGSIADSYGISTNHVATVAKRLVRDGLVEGQRGRSGGLRLTSKAWRTRVGDVVRTLEPDLDLVECFRADGECPIAPACRLRRTLERARKAFMRELDDVTIRALVENAPRLVRLLSHSTRLASG
jgi:Rrf2 family transcriptional regulator, nitric oxide-sensitive transcriptional repressor